MLDTLTVDDFAPHLGQDFGAGEADAATLLRLVSATPLRHQRPGTRPSFSLLFRGAPAPVLEQRIHQLIHPTRGTLGVFLVPVGPDEQGQLYEAIFN